MLKRLLIGLLLVVLSSCNSDDDFVTLTKEELGTIKVIAHRGYWQTGGSSQNSLVSVRLAKENNMQGVEIDVRMSSNGVLYLNHDAGYQGNTINNTDSAILDRLKLGNGESLPRFENFIELVKGYKNFELFIEIKSAGNAAYKREMADKTVEAVMNAGLMNQATILSFDMDILGYAKEKNKSVKTLFITNKVIDFHFLDKNKIDEIGLYYKLADSNPNIIQQILNEGFKVNVWTVNDLKAAKRLIKLPISSITTDIPHKFQ